MRTRPDFQTIIITACVRRTDMLFDVRVFIRSDRIDHRIRRVHHVILYVFIVTYIYRGPSPRTIAGKPSTSAAGVRVHNNIIINSMLFPCGIRLSPFVSRVSRHISSARITIGNLVFYFYTHTYICLRQVVCVVA